MVHGVDDRVDTLEGGVEARAGGQIDRVVLGAGHRVGGGGSAQDAHRMASGDQIADHRDAQRSGSANHRYLHVDPLTRRAFLGR
ncbi:hypothetical protein JMUB6875_19710 [Nocardia sp. JMUB6875]